MRVLTLGLFFVNTLVFWLTTRLQLGVSVAGFSGTPISPLAASAASPLASRVAD
jgi:hypothetical protein